MNDGETLLTFPLTTTSAFSFLIWRALLALDDNAWNWIMALEILFEGLCELLSEEDPIEGNARLELQKAITTASQPQPLTRLADPFLEVMARDSAHPLCHLISRLPFCWAPPRTSQDPLYQEHSHFKAHVELLGPTGLVVSSKVRIGLYGMLPHSEYGLRTHPAEETYIMLAGSAFWKLGDAPYRRLFAGERSYHPSMMPHATRTRDDAFMSIYIWDGDIATDQYRYLGLPDDKGNAGYTAAGHCNN